MTYRSLSAILFTVIVAIEILFFVQTKAPDVETVNKDSKSMWDRTITSTDYKAQSDINRKYTVIIFATVIMGAIVTFSLPNTKSKLKL